LGFSVANAPNIAIKTWLIFHKTSNGGWRQMGEGFVDCLGSFEAGGFTTSEPVFSSDAERRCAKLGPCFRHDRRRWDGDSFASVKTWFATEPWDRYWAECQ
jgi:hypothetical protein